MFTALICKVVYESSHSTSLQDAPNVQNLSITAIEQLTKDAFVDYIEPDLPTIAIQPIIILKKKILAQNYNHYKIEMGVWKVVNKRDKGKHPITELHLTSKGVFPLGHPNKACNMFSVLSYVNEVPEDPTNDVIEVAYPSNSHLEASTSCQSSIVQEVYIEALGLSSGMEEDGLFDALVNEFEDVGVLPNPHIG